ncbi:MAG: hypothetical protein SFU86_11460 [Pirellulaceae bacterium]|nr:hypothetical protein [Pirellulaceae bacterium]
MSRLRFSEWKLCEPLLAEGKVPFEITDNGNPIDMTGGYADLEIDLWVRPAEIPRARELLGKIPAWSGGGVLGDRFLVG